MTAPGSTASAARGLLVCCKVYVSEGRNQALLERLSEIAAHSSPLCALVQRFSDAVYHRSNFTLGGPPGPVADTALRVIEEALKHVDLTQHGDATHPRIGAVDHVSLHPLGSTPLEAAREAALQIGRHVGERWPVPVLLYGVCNGRPLAEVRRGTSYFKGLALDSQLPHADFGPATVDPRLGVLCCGAVPYVQNYNIRLRTADRALAAKVARAVRTRDGGPEGVEALTLVHEGGNMEVACNLLDIGKTPPSQVLALAEGAAAALGVEVEEAYVIGYTGQQIHAEVERLLVDKEDKAADGADGNG